MSERRTIYESARGRRRRRLRAAKLAALVAVLALAAAAVAAAFALRDGSGSADGAAASAAPSSAPSPSPARLARLADVEVRQGDKATFRYRVVAAAGTTAVTLVVRDAGGQQVKARRLTEVAEPGERLEAVVPIDLPPGRYSYELRLGDEGLASPSPSTAQASDGVASATLVVRKPLPPGFPGENAVAAASEWISGRDGDAAFAVVDTNGEDAGGHRQHERFQLASLSKAILLVASLRDDPTPDPATEATLTKMITESDNGAANTVFGQVGAKGMRAVAKAAGLEDYEQGSGWIDTRDSARDQARFFWQLESLVPPKGRALARELLAGVIPIQRWGIPAAAGPEGWTSFFKGGWLGLDNKLMTQAAWLENGKKRWALAVMGDENPTRSYGWDTQKGVTGLLLGQEPTPAYLSVVLE
ncbi:MAG TPA: serine hydrolase [Thermoleophilia bacterium]|nr:serine hydrolase [Thermoleophilia bacterium]